MFNPWNFKFCSTSLLTYSRRALTSRANTLATVFHKPTSVEMPGPIEVCLVLKAIQIEQRIMLSFQLHHLPWTRFFSCWNPCAVEHIFSQVEDVGLSHPPGPHVDFLVLSACGLFCCCPLWTCGWFLPFLLLVLTVWLQVLLSSGEFSGAHCHCIQLTDFSD